MDNVKCTVDKGSYVLHSLKHNAEGEKKKHCAKVADRIRFEAAHFFFRP
jgi:hypothetical protein